MAELAIGADKQALYKDLLEAARKVMRQAYAPISGFRVGAAVLMADGSVYTGCNVENSNLAVGTCAERNAYGKAVSEGKRGFEVVAVVCEKASDCWPCGLCRQFMREFGGTTLIVVEGEDGTLKGLPLNDLIPMPVVRD